MSMQAKSRASGQASLLPSRALLYSALRRERIRIPARSKHVTSARAAIATYLLAVPCVYIPIPVAIWSGRPGNIAACTSARLLFYQLVYLAPASGRAILLYLAPDKIKRNERGVDASTGNMHIVSDEPRIYLLRHPCQHIPCSSYL